MQSKGIKLVLSSSDYKSWAEITSNTLGKWSINIDYSKREPDKDLLKLFGLSK